MPTPPKKLEHHAYADLFPMLDATASKELGDDIEANGLYDHIWLYEGKILDGRNRYAECLKRDIDPKFQEYKGKDALGFAISKNLHRRHLNESQRATVAAKIATAKRGGDRPVSNGKNSTPSKPDAPADPAKPADPTIKEAAERLKVSEATVKIAKTVLKKGAPGLVKAVEKGEVSLNAAKEVAKLPREEQDRIVKGGAEEIKRAAAEARDKPQPPTTRPMPSETKTPRNKPPAAGLGGEKFSFAAIDKAFGALARAVEQMAVAYEEKGGRSHTTAKENLETTIKQLKSWHARRQNGGKS